MIQVQLQQVMKAQKILLGDMPKPTENQEAYGVSTGVEFPLKIDPGNS